MIPFAQMIQWAEDSSLANPAIIVNGQRGELAWVLATIFGAIVMVVGLVILGAFAMKYRPPKPEPARAGARPAAAAKPAGAGKPEATVEKPGA
jgi:hypothetical protein